MDDQLVGRPGLSRDLNYRAIFELLARSGPLSRVNIADRLRLSRPSVSRYVDGLLQASLIAEGESISSKAGRRQTLLHLNPAATMVAGISIRSSLVRLVVADLAGRWLEKRVVDASYSDAHGLVRGIVELVGETRRAMRSDRPLASLVIGIPAAWDSRQHRIHAAPNFVYLEGNDLLARLRQELGEQVLLNTVELDNDINYAALGEGTYGVAKETGSFFYLNIGAGVGGGMMVEGKVHRGVSGFAGELGYLPVCHHGSYHALEDVVSRKAIEARVRKLGLADSAAELFAKVAEGVPEAVQVAEELGEILALALCAPIVLLDPELVVIGGSVGQYGDVLATYIERTLAEHLPLHPSIVGTALDREAALHGTVAQALVLARDSLLRSSLL